ncbi:MAG: septal ring lytic transglycosylase RlpA [SAR86 cluster bacterium]|uniref:Endolytic peptidoglycan transglycosylase RlpA n=1 Tax=SAR86 cluster bacterium TaxID=2030880 RepID=A0A2A4XBM1_9GAMM|nr:MAG: septal ring lytic transglycosylase RlpA [SAR86 cluster bacterium]
MIMNSTVLRISLVSPILLAMMACSSAPAPEQTPESPNKGRYSISQDRAPTRIVDLSAIPEVIPQPLHRTMAGNRSPYTVLGKSYRVLPTEEGYFERGVASWYGEKFHGHKTSNGEVFDMYQVSAAHKSLPIPSFLRVTNLDNNRSIVVRVNDRGPFHGDRVIDLSYAAALKLGYADRGTARVQLESIVATGVSRDREVSSTQNETLRVSSAASKYLQVGAFSELSIAREVSSRVEEITNLPVFIRSVNTSNNRILHRVRVGPISDPGQIQRVSQSVVAANLGSPYTVTE